MRIMSERKFKEEISKAVQDAYDRIGRVEECNRTYARFFDIEKRLTELEKRLNDLPRTDN